MDRNLKKRPAALVFSQATYTTTQMSQLRTTQQQQQAKRRLTTFGTGGGVGAPQTTTEQRVQDRQRISPAASNTSTGNSQDDPLFDDNEEHDALLANLDWPSSLKPNHSAQRQAPQKPIISSASSSSNSPSTAHRSLPGPQKQTPLVVGNPPISADDDFEFDDFPMDDIALKEIDEQENMLLKMTQNVPRPQTSVSAPFSRQEPVNAVLRTGHPSTNLEDELRDLKAQQTKLLQEKNRLLAEMVSKDGEIATVRRGLSQIQSENAQLKFTLARSAEDSHREAAKVKAELLKEQERLKTELLFKDQELKSAVGARTLNVGLPVQPAKRRSTASTFPSLEAFHGSLKSPANKLTRQPVATLESGTMTEVSQPSSRSGSTRTAFTIGSAMQACWSNEFGRSWPSLLQVELQEIKESDRLEFDLNSRIVYHSILDYENADSFSLLNSCVVLAKIFLQSEKGTSLKFIFCILFQTLSLDPSAMNLVFELSPDSEFWNTLKSLHGFLLELFRDKNPFVSHQMMGRLVRVWSVLCLRAIEKGVSLERFQFLASLNDVALLMDYKLASDLLLPYLQLLRHLLEDSSHYILLCGSQGKPTALVHGLQRCLKAPDSQVHIRAIQILSFMAHSYPDTSIPCMTNLLPLITLIHNLLAPSPLVSASPQSPLRTPQKFVIQATVRLIHRILIESEELIIAPNSPDSAFSLLLATMLRVYRNAASFSALEDGRPFSDLVVDLVGLLGIDPVPLLEALAPSPPSPVSPK